MKKRYWLRGGVLFVLLFLVYLLNNLDPAAKSPSISETLFFIILSFLLGSVAGLLYGKIKNKNL
jgi:uncharacterized integral membrane protein